MEAYFVEADLEESRFLVNFLGYTMQHIGGSLFC